jgi:hypothetical protein
MRNEMKCMASLLLAASLGAAAQANASAQLLDGLYAIEVYYEKLWPVQTIQPGGCMIVGDSGQAQVPSLYYWGGNFHGWGECGLTSDRALLLQNRQSVWRVYSVSGSDGRTAYVIKSHVNGRCLIRGQNGNAPSPTLHLWMDPGGQDKFCGLRSADDLLRNGQATWWMNFQSGADMTGGIAHDLRTAHPVFVQPLAFSPLPEAWPQTTSQLVPAVFSTITSPWMFDFVRVGF